MMLKRDRRIPASTAQPFAAQVLDRAVVARPLRRPREVRDADVFVAQMAAEIVHRLDEAPVERPCRSSAESVLRSQASTDNVGVPRLADFMHEPTSATITSSADGSRHDGVTRRALREADRSRRGVPTESRRRKSGVDLRHLRHDLNAGHVARMLAILDPSSTERPRRTAQLIAPRRIDDVGHVRSGSADDVERLAKTASGDGDGLVLSGGGARGSPTLGSSKPCRTVRRSTR